MRSLTQKIIDVVCFIGGTIIFSHTLFSFNNSSREGGSYYYTDLQENFVSHWNFINSFRLSDKKLEKK